MIRKTHKLNPDKPVILKILGKVYICEKWHYNGNGKVVANGLVVDEKYCEQ